MRRWQCTLLLGGLLLALRLGQPSHAHEIGTTQVQLIVGPGDTWSATITTAPTALVNKLEAAGGGPLSRDLTADRVQTLLPPYAGAIAAQVDLRADGAPMPATVVVERVEMPSDITLPAFVVLRASGPLPPGARTITWRYGLVYSTYGVVFTDAAGGAPQTQWLEGDAASPPFALAANAAPISWPRLAAQYLQLGFLHILPEGLDHILFVLGIFLLTTRLRSILVQVTAFTLAHSVTLGLTMYGVISLPARVVEPLIALSVAYVAVENILTARLTPWRPLVVFGFGLLHGMGFAGALADLHLARRDVIPALVSFNVGIELAQLSIIAAAYGAVALVCVSGGNKDQPWYRRRVVIPASSLIAATGLFWTVQRAVGL
ncbi:hydrogenase/urease accessory protein HupE [Nitrospirillum amazonense]|uniref:Hydrogenase/urease accessory protein HupE n=1 Tax=Nitrospirillum amazonense TaxID=28077 RepID=A0A560FGQ9_9PROT|nr:HupE/UreJ family protein [Nitrospirillum amazonense]TWB20784.1 hydrogenase/urease accessory protein HupE [Nitrospirillum amazonense]